MEGQQVNEGEWGQGKGQGECGGRDADTTRTHSSLSFYSSYTVSSASLPRSSPVPSSCGDAHTEGNHHSEEGRRPNSALIMENSDSGIFRRTKSTPSLPEEEEVGRRSLWGWGQRPNLPPPHFYYLPHQPPRNLELKHEDIPEGPERVKRIRERIESDSQSTTEEAADGRTNNQETTKRIEGIGTLLPYRTPSFGGSMAHLSKSSTLPHRSSNKEVRNTSKSGEINSSWRSTLPRNGVSDMYWNGISTIAKRNKSEERRAKVRSSEEEVRVSRSTLERIRERGSSVTYYGGHVVKQGSPADPTHVIMEEIRKQREQEGLVEDLSGALKALGRHDCDWSRQDSSYGSADSTPAGTPGPPTPPPPPSPPTAKVVSSVVKKEQILQPSWGGKCSVVFDFRGSKGGEGGRVEGERVCF